MNYGPVSSLYYAPVQYSGAYAPGLVRSAATASAASGGPTLDGWGYGNPGSANAYDYSTGEKAYSDTWAAGRAGYHLAGVPLGVHALQGGQVSKGLLGRAIMSERLGGFGSEKMAGAARWLMTPAGAVERFYQRNMSGSVGTALTGLGGTIDRHATSLATGVRNFGKDAAGHFVSAETKAFRTAVAALPAHASLEAFKSAAKGAFPRASEATIARRASNALEKRYTQTLTQNLEAAATKSGKLTENIVKSQVRELARATGNKDVVNKIAKTAENRAARAVAQKAATQGGGIVAKGLARFLPFVDMGVAALDVKYAQDVTKDPNASTLKKGLAWTTAGLSTLGSIPVLGTLVKPVTGSLSFLTGMTAAVIS